MTQPGLLIDIAEAWQRRAVEWATRRLNHTVDRVRMNPRTLAERLDDAIMGETASVAVAQFLIEQRGQKVVAYDDIRTDAYMLPDPAWDLAIRDARTGWPTGGNDILDPPAGATTFSVKSSRIPARYDDQIGPVIENCDFKILKYNDRIGADLNAAFEVQIYYALQSTRFDSSFSVDADSIKKIDIDSILSALRIRERFSKCCLIGFASRESIIANSERLALAGKRTVWRSLHKGHSKEMWVAPLVLARMPSRISY